MERAAGDWQQVEIDGVAIVVSTTDPAAVVRRVGVPDLTVGWPDLDVGLRSPSATVLGAPTGAWVFYRPTESEEDSTPPGCIAAVHLDPDGVITTHSALTSSSLAGATRHGLWLDTSGHPGDPDAAAQWRSEREITVLRPDGGAHTLTIDRPIAFAFDADGAPAAFVYADAPDAHPAGRGTSYVYRYARLLLPTGTLPDGIRVDATATTVLDEQSMFAAMAALTPQTPRTAPPDPGVRWQTVDLPRAERDAAVAAVVREFAHLDSYWHAADGAASPLSRGLHDSRVDVVGEWPSTKVEVSFAHPLYPEGRLRRTIRVFDDAGRVAPAMYASIHLMEDLDTQALPPASAARHGIMDI